MRVFHRRMALLLAAACLALTAAACREEEQGRVLLHKKGTYQGPQDNPLDDAQREDLQRRVGQQRAP